MKRHASMNRIYRVVRGHLPGLVAAALSLVAGLFLAPPAQAGPSGGQVSTGAGTISQAGYRTTIDQTSQNLSINWQGFSIGANETVRFNQPSASSVVLNRIIGQDPSQIVGGLSANGQVFVVNPNGVLFGATAQVNVGALVASTLGLSDANLLAGNYHFESAGGAAGRVLNQGTLTAAPGGYIALLAPDVRNDGQIAVSQGAALLGAGDQLTLHLANGSLLGYRIDQGSLNALVANHQAIRADGGQVFLSAQAADAVSTAVVNNAGVIEAKGITTRGGTIRLEADVISQTGTLDVSGNAAQAGGAIALQARAILDAGTTLANGQDGGSIALAARDAIVQSASSTLQANGARTGGRVSLDGGNSLFSSAAVQARGGQGGSIDVLGQRVVLAAATVDASGTQQGGVIRIGGDWHGANAKLANAQTTLVNGASSVKADGGQGQVVVWSDQKTEDYGRISANHGGSIEVSSKGNLTHAGQADTGPGGSLLLDPANIIIDNSLGPAAFSLIDPHPVAGNGFGTATTVLSGNGNVVVNVGGDSLMANGAGAVYLFNSMTGALLSTLTGSHAGDAVGNGSVTALRNGNFVVTSSQWNSKAGAVTWGSGTQGVSGVVSDSNSLVGSTANDQVGSGGITQLSNGNYVVSSPNWHGKFGAASWGSGLAGVTGFVSSSSKSLVGSHANDQVGVVVTTLGNGNYVLSTALWNTKRGAVT